MSFRSSRDPRKYRGILGSSQKLLCLLSGFCVQPSKRKSLLRRRFYGIRTGEQKGVALVLRAMLFVLAVAALVGLRAARQWFSEIVNDPEYRKSFRARAIAGELPPAMEVLAHHYVFGKPKETIDMNVQVDDYSQLPPEELEQRSAEIHARVSEIREQMAQAEVERIAAVERYRNELETESLVTTNDHEQVH